MEELIRSSGETSTSSSKDPPPASICALKKNNTNSNDRSSPEPNCAICLSKLQNKSFTDSCLHQFCFTCLLEWSKVKAQCPLCKQDFKSIIHNVRSEEDYDQYHLAAGDPSPQADLSLQFEIRPSFRYRTTMTYDRFNRYSDRNRSFAEYVNQTLPETQVTPDGIARFSWRRHRELAPADFRRTVYRFNLWTRPLPDITGRHRQCSPDFFRMNPAQMHRLVPWLNRELSVLLQMEAHMTIVLDIILNLIVRHPIQAEEIRLALVPYLGRHAAHFLHEFYMFASSPYDLIGYDFESQYYSSSELRELLRPREEVVSDNNSDIVILEETAPTVDVNSSDSEVEIIGYVKPRHERTPVIVQLSDEDNEINLDSPVAGPSRETHPLRTSEIAWVSDDDDYFVTIDEQDYDDPIISDAVSFSGQSQSSLERDPDYIPSTSSKTTNNKSKSKIKSKKSKTSKSKVYVSSNEESDCDSCNSKKRTKIKSHKHKRKQKRRISISSSSSSNFSSPDSESISESNYSSDEDIPKTKKNKSSKPLSDSSQDFNPKYGKNNRNNRIESDSDSRSKRQLKSSKKINRHSYLTCGNEKDSKRTHKRKHRQSSSSSWRIRTPKSEDNEEEAIGNRPRLRSIVISKSSISKKQSSHHLAKRYWNSSSSSE